MRFLKQRNLHRRTPNDTTLYSDVTNSSVYIYPTLAGSVALPVGDTAHRPQTPVVGMIRYNTDTNELEVYEGSSATWRNIRYKESTQITQQNLGAGDGGEVYFGPLNPAPPAIVANGTTWGAQNIIVVVENVLQLSGTNYTVVQNPTLNAEIYTGALSVQANTGATTLYFNTSLVCTGVSGTGSTATITFSTQTAAPFAVGSSIVVTGFTPVGYNGTYTVTSCTTSAVSFANTTTAALVTPGEVTSTVAVYPSGNFVGATLTGSVNIQSNTTISSIVTNPTTDALISMTIDKTLVGAIGANASLVITEASAAKVGYYLQFSSPPPYGKIVTVLHGFDK